jgi:hypothetical protein
MTTLTMDERIVEQSTILSLMEERERRLLALAQAQANVAVAPVGYKSTLANAALRDAVAAVGPEILPPDTSDYRNWIAFRAAQNLRRLAVMDEKRAEIEVELAAAIEAGKADAWKYANREIKENAATQAVRRRLTAAEAERVAFLAKNRSVDDMVAECKKDEAPTSERLAAITKETEELITGCVKLQRDPDMAWLSAYKAESEPLQDPKTPEWMEIGEYFAMRAAQDERVLYRRR